MGFQSPCGWARIVRAGVLPLAAVIGAVLLCGHPYSEGCSLSDSLGDAAVRRDELLRLQAEVQEFNEEEKAVLEDFIKACSQLVPRNDPSSRLYEIINKAASASDVEILSCVVEPRPDSVRRRRNAPSTTHYRELSIDISACCQVASVGPFLQTLSSSPILLVPNGLEMERTDERFPQILIHLEARSYVDPEKRLEESEAD